MSISINWLTKTFSVPQSDLTLIGGTLYEMDTNVDFRHKVNEIMAGEEGIVYEDPISHNTEYVVSGVTYARKIEMINSYKLQFTPDSQWSVRLAGSNNNLFDIYGGTLVQNQVQVIPQNSAGLISQLAIEFSEYAEGVFFDPTNSTGKATSGTFTPAGTRRSPSDNLADVKTILSARGLSKIRLLGNWTTGATDNIDEYTMVGEGWNYSTITVTSGCSTSNTEFEDVAGTGTLSGIVEMRRCKLLALSGLLGTVKNSVLSANLNFTGTSADLMEFLNCDQGSTALGVLTFDMNGDGPALSMRKVCGGFKLTNKSGTAKVVVDYVAGQFQMDSTVTAGTIIVRGMYWISLNDATGITLQTGGSSEQMPTDVWAYERP